MDLEQTAKCCLAALLQNLFKKSRVNEDGRIWVLFIGERVGLLHHQQLYF